MRLRSMGAGMALAAVVSFGASAQTAEPDSHVKAANELLDAMNVEKTVNDSMEIMLKSQIDANPQLAPVEGVMRSFLNKYMSWDALRGEYAKLYMAAFTEAELRELATFYRTPIGKKLIGALPQIMQGSAEMAQSKLTAHVGELEDAITKRLQELDKAPTPAAPGTP